MYRHLPFAYRLLQFAILLFSIAPLPLLAQEVGLHLSVARTTLSESGEADPATRVGGGISLDFPFSDNVGFRTGAFYVRKGLVFSEEIPVSGGTYFDYLELPALFRLGIPVDGSARPYALLGPTVGINVGCRIDADIGQGPISQDCEDLGESLRKLDLGLTGGLGVAIGLSGGASIRLEALYNLGLLPVDSGRVTSSTDEKNRAATGMVGIAFPIG